MKWLKENARGIGWYRHIFKISGTEVATFDNRIAFGLITNVTIFPSYLDSKLWNILQYHNNLFSSLISPPFVE